MKNPSTTTERTTTSDHTRGLRSSNFLLQQGDLFELGPGDLICKEVHICICDAQLPDWKEKNLCLVGGSLVGWLDAVVMCFVSVGLPVRIEEAHWGELPDTGREIVS